MNHVFLSFFAGITLVQEYQQYHWEYLVMIPCDDLSVKLSEGRGSTIQN